MTDCCRINVLSVSVFDYLGSLKICSNYLIAYRARINVLDLIN